MISLTETAASQVKRIKADQKYENDVFLRVAAVPGGCSGFSYKLEFDKDFSTEQDDEFDSHGVRVVVDKRSALYLTGTTIDYYEGLDRHGFTFDNPNVVKSCGCGSSFQV